MSPMHARWSRLYRGTKAELVIEEAVAALGIPYRTNFPGFIFGFRYFPDFLLPTLGVVLEIDDRSHGTPEKQASDAERTKILQDLFGWRVARCTNAEALENPKAAVQRMLRTLDLWPIPANLPRLAEALPKPRKLRMQPRNKKE